MELQGRQDLRGAQLDSERRHVEAPAVALCVDALQEHWPGSTDQVHQSVLQRAATVTETLTPSSPPPPTHMVTHRKRITGFTHCLQLHGDALGVSAHGRHSSTESFPDDAVPLQGALAAPLHPAQTLTQRREGDSGGEQGFDNPAEEEKKRNYRYYLLF